MIFTDRCTVCHYLQERTEVDNHTQVAMLLVRNVRFGNSRLLGKETVGEGNFENFKKRTLLKSIALSHILNALLVSCTSDACHRKSN